MGVYARLHNQKNDSDTSSEGGVYSRLHGTQGNTTPTTSKGGIYARLHPNETSKRDTLNSLLDVTDSNATIPKKRDILNDLLTIKPQAKSTPTTPKSQIGNVKPSTKPDYSIINDKEIYTGPMLTPKDIEKNMNPLQKLGNNIKKGASKTGDVAKSFLAGIGTSVAYGMNEDEKQKEYNRIMGYTPHTTSKDTGLPEKISAGLGQLTGYGVQSMVGSPIGGKAAQAVSKVPVLSSKIGQFAIQQGLPGTIMAGTLAKAQGKSAKESAIIGLENGAMDVAGAAFLKGAGKVGNGAINTGKNIIEKVSENIPKYNINFSKNIKLKENPNVSNNTPILPDLARKDKVNNAIKKLNLDTLKPQKDLFTKVSKFKNGTLAKTAEIVNPEIQNVIKNSEMMYNVKPNATTVERAKQTLDKDFYGHVKRIMNTEGALSDAEDTAMVGLINKGLAKEAEQTGDYSLYTAFTKKTRAKVTNTAQALQSLKTWQMDTPENVVLYAQKLMDTANHEMAQKLGNKFKGAEFKPDDIKYIHEKSKEILNMPTNRTREIKIGELRQFIGDKIPVSTSDKIKSFVRMSMLSSPTTGLRNFIGNILYNTAENIKQPLSGLVDLGISKVTKKRTTPILPSIGAQIKGMGEGAYRQIDDLLKGVDTSKFATATADMLDERVGTTFKNPVMKKFENYTKFLVRDDIFWQGAYNQRINELQKLNKTSEITDDMIEQAKAFADDRVFQNNSKIAEQTLKVRRDTGLLGDVILPFAKTPANILSKTTDYLPITGVYKLGQELNQARKGLFDQKRFVDLVGRVGLGTALTSLGYDLYNKGAITVNPSKSKAENEFNKDIGKLPYAIKVGDKHIDISNYSPIAGLILAGANMAKKDNENGNIENINKISKLYDGSKEALNSVLDASYLKGVKDFFSNAQNPEYGLTGAVVESAKNVASMGLPNLVKRANYALDPYSRETYSNQKSLFQDLKNKTIPNLPVLSKHMPKKVNGFGEDMKRTNKSMGIIESLFNPFITAEKTKDPVKLEVDRLYQSSKESGILPEYDKYFEKIQYNGKSFVLNTNQKLQYKKSYGNMLMKDYMAIMNTPRYRNSNDEQKAKALKHLQDHIRQLAKEKTLRNIRKELNSK